MKHSGTKLAESSIPLSLLPPDDQHPLSSMAIRTAYYSVPFLPSTFPQMACNFPNMHTDISGSVKCPLLFPDNQQPLLACGMMKLVHPCIPPSLE